MENALIQNRKYQTQNIVLWVAIGSLLMLFTSLTSAYIVRKSAGDWSLFNMPTAFYTSTIVIILSSILLIVSSYFYRANNLSLTKLTFGVSTILGIAFLVLQYQGWLQLNDIGVYLDGNPSGSFLFVLSGLHAFHVLGGVIALIFGFFYFIKQKEYNLHGEQKLRLISTYWHFVDLLWIALLLFFVYA